MQRIYQSLWKQWMKGLTAFQTDFKELSDLYKSEELGKLDIHGRNGTLFVLDGICGLSVGKEFGVDESNFLHMNFEKTGIEEKKEFKYMCFSYNFAGLNKFPYKQKDELPLFLKDEMVESRGLDKLISNARVQNVHLQYLEDIDIFLLMNYSSGNSDDNNDVYLNRVKEVAQKEISRFTPILSS